MAMSLQDQLSFAEQGIQLDKARVEKLTAQRDELAAWGGDTSNLDASIAEAQRDVDAGIQDVLDLQGQIDNEANAEQDDTAASDVENSDEDATEEDLSDDEQQQLADNEASNEGDEPAPPILKEGTYDEFGNPINPMGAKDENYSHEGRGHEQAKKDPDRYIPRDNPLHDYATYTYSITLYILTDEDINALTTNPRDWAPNQNRVKQCLISSGGKNAGQWARNDNFKEDFYIQDLKMTTVIGLNNRSKATNAIDISFTVLEPYGMSLLDRVMKTAEQIRAPNFKAMPYLLEIEFYGYDDQGTAVKLDSQRKRIPIQIIEMKIKASTRGAEYAIKAVPWNHQALSQSAASTPVNFEVKASTVAEFFHNNTDDQTAVSRQDAEKMAANSTIQRKEAADKEAKKTDASGRLVNDPRRIDKPEPDPNARTPTDEEVTKAKGVVNHAFAVNSYCGGVNAWYTDLVIKKLRATKDEIRFNIHEDIAQTKIVAPANKDVSRSAVKEDKPADAAKAAQREANKVFTDATAFPISAGTSITQVIDMVMRNSEYITDQIKDPKNTTPQELADKEGKPLKWYKVIPTVEVGTYDYALNKFSTITTYHVMPYTVYDSKHPNGPSTNPKGSIKKYFYSYTGKNKDIIDFQIDFDTLFYTAVTAGAAKWQADQIQQAQQQKDDAAKVAADSHPAAAELVNRQLRLVSAQPQSAGAGGTQNGVKPILAADIQKGQYSNSKGDMLNLKLKITGDPELIKQDDIYTNPSQGGYADQIGSKGIMNDNGSIPMDDGEVITEVQFRTILDMDDSTGLPYQDQAFANNSVFTGQYRILTVDNVFSNGRFEQVVDMVRIPDVINESATDAGAGKQVSKSESMSDKTDDTDPNARKPNTDVSDSDPYSGWYGPDVDANPEQADPYSGWYDETESYDDTMEAITDEPEQDPSYDELHQIDVETEPVEIDDWDNPPPSVESTQTEVNF